MTSPRHIISADNPLVRLVQRLVRDPLAYRTVGRCWIEGAHLCASFVAQGGTPAHAVIAQSAWSSQTLRALAQHGGEIVVLPDRLFERLSPLPSPAGLGFVIEVSALATALDPGADAVLLDRVQDAGNVGSILRCAAAFGFQQVAALKGTAGLWSPKVLRAAMGAHFALRLVEGLEPEAVLRSCPPLVATSSHAGQALPGATLPRPHAWVFGHEGQGVARELLSACVATLRIPQPGGQESLNVAAAAAICLYEARRSELRDD